MNDRGKEGHGNPWFCLSMVEKYLLRQGWSVADHWDAVEGLVKTVVRLEDRGWELVYAKPTHAHVGRSRQAELDRVLEGLAALESTDEATLKARIEQEYARAPEGFRCRVCGDCCQRFRDAFQGLVSQEEVEAWRGLGLVRILRLVQREERDGKVMYAAWKNPKTGRYFRRCPWLRTSRADGTRYCAIHAHKPLKCRAFPLSREQAEYSGCRGFEEDVDFPTEARGTEEK